MDIARTVQGLGLWDGTDVEVDETPTMASPSWWGADSRHYIVSSAEEDPVAGRSAHVKVYEDHARAYVDVPAAISAATVAGEAGIGPRVLASDEEAGVLVTEDLSEVSRTATMDRFRDRSLVHRLIEQRTKVHELQGITRRQTVFEAIDHLYSMLPEDHGALPRDVPWMLRSMQVAREQIGDTSAEHVPCHGDANLSNLLVLEDGSTRLVDWDSAALMDPLQDLGTVLLEHALRDRGAEELVEAYCGRWDPALFDRARLYGVAECVRRGLLGAYCDYKRPGSHEYSKFGDWMFLRARTLIVDHRFDERVRSA